MPGKYPDMESRAKLTNVIFFSQSDTQPQTNVSMTDPKPKDRAMLKKFIIADAAACLFMHFKEFGISGENSCIAQDTTLTKAMTRQASDIEKLMYAKAIGYMASIALDRPIGVVTAEYMYEVLIQDGHESDAFKRVHGKAFPRELTDAGWRSSFKAINDYVAKWID